MQPPASNGPTVGPAAGGALRRWLTPRRIIFVLIVAVIGPCAAIEAPREVSRWYLAAALEEKDAKNNQQAEARIDQAIRWNPREPTNYLVRAELREAKGDHQGRDADLGKALEYGPENPQLLIDRARLLHKLGRTDEAVAHIDKAATLTENDPRVFLECAKLLHEFGRTEEALTYLDQAADLEGDSPDALFERAQLLQIWGEHDKAIAAFEEINRQSLASGIPHRSVALNGLAYARAVANQDVEQGLKEIDEALALYRNTDSMRDAMLDTRGFLYYRAGKYEQALRDLDTALQGMNELVTALPPRAPGPPLNNGDVDDPLEQSQLSTAVILYHRSLVLEKLGRTDDAKKDFDRARELLGRDPDETIF